MGIIKSGRHWWNMPIIVALGKERCEDQELKLILADIASFVANLSNMRCFSKSGDNTTLGSCETK